MNKVIKVALICLASNMLFVFSLYFNRSSESFLSVGLFWIMYLIIQFIFGLILAFQSNLRDTGKGILLGAAIGLLIGFTVCSKAIGG